MRQQAVRVSDDDERDGMGMGAAGYVVLLVLVIGVALLIAAVLWLPRIAQAWGWL